MRPMDFGSQLFKKENHLREEVQSGPFVKSGTLSKAGTRGTDRLRGVEFEIGSLQ